MNPAKDGHGTLNWMVVWQSQDGRLQITYEETEALAVKRVKHLKSLGRLPQVWQRWE